MSGAGKYDHLSHEALVKLLERRDAQFRYGLVWEREGLEADRALNDDFVALDLDVGLSTLPGEDGGWRNLVIEGDNWDALRALRLAYTGRIRCILIDPPYNTGSKDFTYNDRFVGQQDRYRQSLWLEFLYRRLVVARDLLADDGAIIVCINDENRARLDLLMEQVFPGMRLGSFVWRTKDTNNSDKRRNWSGVHEHVLVYCNAGFSFIGPQSGGGKFVVRPEFGPNPVRLDPVTKAETWTTRNNTYYPVKNPVTELWYPCAPNRVWAFWSETKPPRKKKGLGPSMESLVRDGLIHFPAEESAPFLYQDRNALDRAIESGNVPRDGKGRPLLRADLSDLDFWINKPIAHRRISRIVFKGPEHDEATSPVGSWIGGVNEDNLDKTAQTIRTDRQGVATTEIEALFGQKAFSFPKPFSLIHGLLRATVGDGDIVLDFFAGSGTTGHAVFALNAEDDATRRFILVSSKEATTIEPNKNLCQDVCAARLRKAISGTWAQAKKDPGDLPSGTVKKARKRKNDVPEMPTEPLAGDFAYLRARGVDWDDVVYDMNAEAVWTIIQLRQDRALRLFDTTSAIQVSSPDSKAADSPTLVFLPQITDDALAELRTLATVRLVTVFTPAPGNLRDLLGMPNVAIEEVPDRLLAEFPRQLMGI